MVPAKILACTSGGTRHASSIAWYRAWPASNSPNSPRKMSEPKTSFSNASGPPGGVWGLMTPLHQKIDRKNP